MAFPKNLFGGCIGSICMKIYQGKPWLGFCGEIIAVKVRKKLFCVFVKQVSCDVIYIDISVGKSSPMGVNVAKIFARVLPYFRWMLTRETLSFTSLLLNGRWKVFTWVNEPVYRVAQGFIFTRERKKNFCKGSPLFYVMLTRETSNFFRCFQNGRLSF